MKRLLRVIAGGVLLVAGTDTVLASAPILPTYGSAVFGGIDNTICRDAGGNLLNNSTCYFSDSSDQVIVDLRRGGNRSAAQASLSVGYLGVQVSDSGSYSFANNVIWDVLTFSGVTAGEQATITMRGETSSSGSGSAYAVAQLFPLVDNIGAYSNLGLLEGGAVILTTSDPYTFQESFNISNGDPYLFEVAVSASAVDGSASINDPFSIQLPQGVTFTSASGLTYSAVPEPITLSLFGAGLAGAVAMRRRKKNTA